MANTLKKQRCRPCINQSYAFWQVFGRTGYYNLMKNVSAVEA